MRRKGDLPSKPCAVCGRPFSWRRKWAKVWDEVRYCSEACRARRGRERKGERCCSGATTSPRSAMR
ncbi:DUF2256 domain-containing protein [Elioraea tepida]|uniref:DUF2256 domain-containing protein n=1 Tax=Elioraea tepida TaxID=2843330 RepID=A0A975U427_9PROT|nr:DUF2256 domain-containing protein [Elioraea tepida]QXM25363.1 DUF2256 domain-containing protein [Elioraea tepida]